jgi:hypothetical protein
MAQSGWRDIRLGITIHPGLPMINEFLRLQHRTAVGGGGRAG